MRWIPVVSLIVLVTLLASCEPEYVEPAALEPLEGSIGIANTAVRITSMLAEHDARIAAYENRLASSEEQLAFDLTRAKRQLVGKSDVLRPDVSAMLDVHEQDARTEIARVRARLATFDESVKTLAAERLDELARLDPASYDEARLETLASDVEDSMSPDELEGAVTGAQELAAQTSERFTNELNKLRG